VPRKVWTPRPAFGLFVAHEGPLFGWLTRLRVPGAQRIGADLYRLDVPPQGFFNADIEIEALESPRRPHSGHPILTSIERLSSRRAVLPLHPVL